MKRFFLKSLFVPFISALLLLAGCGGKVPPGTSEVTRTEVTGVRVSELKPAEVDEFIEAVGTVKAKSSSAVSSKVMGTVTSVRVKEGDRVKSGQLVLTIDDRDIAQKIAAAEAGYQEALKGLQASKENLALMDLTYERYKKLFEGKAVSEQEFDTISTQRKSAVLEYERMQETAKRASANVAEAKVYRTYAMVTSPVSGVVSEKRIDAGSTASPGMPLLTIDDTSSFILEANMDESLSGRLKSGMPVDIIMDSIGKKIKGNISEVVPSVNPASRTFLVKAVLKDAGLRAGLYAKLRVPVGKKTLILAPEPAVVTKGNLTGVYAVDDKGVITYRLIRTGSLYDHNVEVLSGITSGDKVITEGVDKAVDGGVVKAGK